MVLEASPLRLGSGGDSGGKRTESGEDSLHEPFDGGGVDGARSFACVSSCNFSSGLTLFKIFLVCN